MSENKITNNKKLSKKHVIEIISKAVIYFLLICISYIYLVPIFKMISLLFMSEKDIVNPAVEWIPQHATLKNIRVAAHVLDMPKTLFNSIWFSALLAVCQTVVSALTGFSFARFNFKFKKLFFILLLVAFIMPIPVLLVPRIMMFVTAQNMTGLKFIGTPVPQLLMAVFGQGVYSTILILIFYNFFRLIPYSLDEAAMIDGATISQIFYHIAIKLSLTTILLVFLFSFVWNWNETYQTSTFLRSSINLLPLRLSTFDSLFNDLASGAQGASGESKINEAYKLTATFISILPMLVLYAFVQKQFIAGIENTGITGE